MNAIGRLAIVLSRHVHLIVVRRAWKELSGREDVLRHRAFGDVRPAAANPGPSE